MAYKQAKNRKCKLTRTYEQIKGMKSHYTGSGVWFDDDRGFHYKYSASSTPGYAKSLRRISNKKVRKAAEVGNYGDYRRLYDYKWELF